MFKLASNFAILTSALLPIHRVTLSYLSFVLLQRIVTTAGFLLLTLSKVFKEDIKALKMYQNYQERMKVNQVVLTVQPSLIFHFLSPSLGEEDTQNTVAGLTISLSLLKGRPDIGHLFLLFMYSSLSLSSISATAIITLPSLLVKFVGGIKKE